MKRALPIRSYFANDRRPMPAQAYQRYFPGLSR